MDDTKPEVLEVGQQEEEEPVPVEEQRRFLQEEKGRYLVNLMWEAALLLTVLVGVIVIFLLLRHVARRRRYQSRNRQERLVILMKCFLYLGELYGFGLEGSETLSAYEKRVGGCLDTPELSFKQICILYQSIRFGGETLTDEQLKQLESYGGALEKQYLPHCGRMRRLWFYLR